MTDFFMTRMGQRFYESTMPGLVKQLADLNENLRKQNEPDIKLEIPGDPMLCSKHGGCGFQSDCGKCRHEDREESAASSGAASILAEEDKAILEKLKVESSVADCTHPTNARVRLVGQEQCDDCSAYREYIINSRYIRYWSAWRQSSVPVKRRLDSEPHQVGEPSTAEEINVANRVIRDGYRKGVMGEVTHSEAVTMLMNLLARIHRDGGHYTEQVGLAKSVYDAHIKVAEQNAWAGRVDRDTMYRADLNSLAENDVPCHTDAGNRVRSIIDKLKQQLRDMTKRRDNLDGNHLNLHGQYRHTVETLDVLQQERDELWSENQRLKGIARGLDFERELRSRAEANLDLEKKAHEVTRRDQIPAREPWEEVNRMQARLKLVNDKLGIKMEDTFEHFREQLNNALDDD